MTDLEGITNRLLDQNKTDAEIIAVLVQNIQLFKEISQESAESLAAAILDEVKTVREKAGSREINSLLEYPKADATMHDLGVGCRGEGDFFVHGLIAKVAESGDPLISPIQQDDAGAVQIEGEGNIIVVAVDGTHSRLSDFPFIAGFHVARAALRDVYVKGAVPVAMFDDLHLADDGDVGKLFDFVAGVSTVAEATNVPLVAGSTLRVGGDMVIGERLVSGVGAVGVVKNKENLLARRSIRAGDAILMTKGAGGGTITTTAVYSGKPEIIKETLNIDFIKACEAIQRNNLNKKISAALDVTNGGLRGDANEVCKTANVGLIFEEEGVRSMVNKKVFDLLQSASVDYLGVSLDSLLIFCPVENKEEIISAINSAGVEITQVGNVVSNPQKAFIVNSKNEKTELTPKFRESAYTRVKMAVGEHSPQEKGTFYKGAEQAFQKALEKKRKLVKKLRG